MNTFTPYYDVDGITIYNADSLNVLPHLPTIDAVVTDPPYASGTRKESGKSSSGSMLRRTSGPERMRQPIDLDQMTTTGFVWTMRQIMQDSYHLLPDGGSFLSFIDWRQWPTLVGAFESCNYRIQNMIVWDKVNMGLGNGFRNTHELVAHASKGVPNVYNRGTKNVLAEKRIRPDAIGHPSPKPVDLIAQLIAVVAPSGGTVLDPFMGSGSTLVAAKRDGFKAIGIETNAAYCDIAIARLNDTYATHPSLFEQARPAA
jgi:DNA modification methylase